MIIYRVHLIFSWRYILVMEEEKNKRILLRILSAIHKLVNLRTDLLKPGV
jgi:hypothetical protein